MEEDPLAIRRLRALTIEIAIEEMRSGNECKTVRGRTEKAERIMLATVWLGSKEAGKWLQVLGDQGDQVEVLRALHWTKYAREVLDAGEPMTMRQRRLLEIGIEALFD